MDMPEGKRIGVLYSFIKGTKPAFETDIKNIGVQVGRLHNIMQTYPRPLIKRGRAFFIDRYVNIMKENQYCAAKVAQLESYGNQLWLNMEQAPIGFCHGDLHSDNMIKTESGVFTLFDFDVVSEAYTIIDVAVLSDQTNFNKLDESAYDSTRQMFERFYQGYVQQRVLNRAEILAIFSFIAIRHYELIATMVNYRLHVEGRHWLSDALFDQQYEWLMKWHDICNQRRVL